MYSLIAGNVFEIALDVGVRWPRGRNPPSVLLWNASHKNALLANCIKYTAANWSWRWRVLVRTPGLKSSFNAFIPFVYMLDLITGMWNRKQFMSRCSVDDICAHHCAFESVLTLSWLSSYSHYRSSPLRRDESFWHLQPSVCVWQTSSWCCSDYVHSACWCLALIFAQSQPPCRSAC